MKTPNLIQFPLLALSLLFPAAAQAGGFPAAYVPDGYYRHAGDGSLGEADPDRDVFLMTGRDQVRYGMIYSHVSDRAEGRGGLFKVEDLAGGIESWTPLFQNGDGLLTTTPSQYAAFAVRAYQDGRSINLKFTPTGQGQSIGCGYEFVAKPSRKWRWTEIPSHGFEIKNASGDEGIYGNRTLTTSFNLDRARVSGDFRLQTSVNTGVALLKQTDLSPYTASGLAESGKIVGVVATIKPRILIGTEDYHFMITKVPTAAEASARFSCLWPSTYVKEKGGIL